MALKKTAVALPEELLEALDREADARGESRNRLITRILRLALRARRDAAITRQLDELFAHQPARQDQRQTAGELDAAGSAWDDERW